VSKKFNPFLKLMARHGPLNLLIIPDRRPGHKTSRHWGNFLAKSREGINQDCLTFPWTDGSAHKMTFSRLDSWWRRSVDRE